MSRKTGKRKRIDLFDRGNTACPICLTEFTRHQVILGEMVTLEHIPIKALGGKDRCLTCENCNAQAGRGIDQAAALSARDPFYVTTDILGKRGKFKMSLDGKTLTPPFARYSEQDWQNLENSESGSFTMSISIPNFKAVETSSLKSAYLALFSLMGPVGGYIYAKGEATTPIRQQIMNPLKNNSVGEYVMNAPGDQLLMDIMLVSEPLPCWIVRVSEHLVILPLRGDSWISQPKRDMKRLGGGQPLSIAGYASWPFSRFGAFSTVSVHLAGADPAKSMVGLWVRGKLPNGFWLEGTCISQLGESATLLCSGSTVSRSKMNMS